VDRLLAITVLVLAIPCSAVAGMPGSSEPRSVSVPRLANATPTRVAKKSKKKATPSAAASTGAPPVKIVSSGNDKVTLQQKKTSTTAYLVEPGKSFKVELVGAGKLTLYLHQLVPAAGSPNMKAAAGVSIDGKPSQKVALNTKVATDTRIIERKDKLTTTAKSFPENLKAGKHTAEVTVAAGNPPVLVALEFLPTGSKKAAPIIDGTRTNKDLMAAALSDDDDDSGIVAAPSPPPGPPATPAAVPPPPTPAKAAQEIAAVEVAGGGAPEAPPVAETPEQVLQRRIVQGEIRDGMLGTYDSVTVTKTTAKETLQFYRVPEEKSFTVMVAGPGELTVRLHRLIDPLTAATQEGAPYSIAMLEDDVLLQQLSGNTKRTTTWELKGAAGVTPFLSEPREYKVKLGGRTSRIAVQVAESPLGMVIRYSFVPEAGNLASMVVGIGEDDGGDISLGTSAAALKPTMVMEVDVSERIVVQVREGYLSLAANAGGFVPTAGGDPGFLAGAQVTFNLPWAGRMFLLSAQGLFERHTLAIAVGDLDGGAIRASSAVYAIPILGKLTTRLPLGFLGLGAFVHAGGGLCYVNASRTSLGSTVAANRWTWAVRGGGGVEMDIKVGWVGVEAAYLYAPAADYGHVLSGYSPTGPSVALQYRLGL
jgi:hypothetical protein